jgi:hypothetical protein
MSDARKPKQVRLYLSPDSEAKMASMKTNLGDQMSEAQVASLLVSEGLKAIEANGWRFELPLRLIVATNEPPKFAINETPPRNPRAPVAGR